MMHADNAKGLGSSCLLQDGRSAVHDSFGSSKAEEMTSLLWHFYWKRSMGILHSSRVTEKVPCDIMASATPLCPRLHLPLRLQWWRKVLYQKYLPGPDIQLSPISFLSSPSLPDTRSFFFFNNPTLTALLTLPAHCQWDFMESDGCIMNMDAIEIQSCCCLEALCASLNVRLHDLQRRDQGTLTFFSWFHALWKDNGALHVEQKWKRTEKEKKG